MIDTHSLRKFAFHLSDEERMLHMIFEKKTTAYLEECDYILIPLNDHHSHWTTMVLNIWNSCIYYYDPIGKGIQNGKAIKPNKILFQYIL